MSNFWQFRNVTADEGELLLYGPIRSQKPWWDDSNDGIYAKQFTDDLKALGAIKSLTVRLNSNGGDVFAAVAIYTQLKSHAAYVTVVIEGIAASAATIIMMAADTIKAPAAAQVMIHDPLLGLMGYYNVTDMEKMKSVLESVKSSILNAYINKTGRDRTELSAIMQKETWMSAEAAKEEGFVDEIMFEEVIDASFTNDNRFMVVNSIAHDMSIFETRPIIKNTKYEPPVIPVIPLNTIKTKGSEELEIKNVEELRNKYPELCKQLENAASEAGATKERDRMKSIDAISATVATDLVNKAKYDQPITAQDLAFEALKADAGKGLKFINQRADEMEESDEVKAEALKNEDATKEAASVDAVAAAVNTNKNRGPRS
jgi:ATP-dependent protease ClpP protease subunit